VQSFGRGDPVVYMIVSVTHVTELSGALSALHHKETICRISLTLKML
jgi:hypothetical protein